MKKNIFRKLSLMLVFVMLFSLALTGCGNQENKQDTSGDTSVTDNRQSEDSNSHTDNAGSDSSQSGENTSGELIVRFGDDGDPFTMYLYDNPTAAAIARHVGTADWRLPIYHYDDYDDWEVMQYYDIPSRYEIPSNPETVTSEKAGTVYYSEPNRIILFYGDAQVNGEYTPVGYFNFTEDFKSAVENNPVLAGWDTKMVNISKAD